MIQHIINTQTKIYQSKDEMIGVFVVPKFEYYYVYAQNKIKIEEYQEALTKLLEVVGTEYPFYKLILSLGNLTHTPIVGRAWFATHFAPTLYQKTNKEVIIAVVKPQNKFEAVTIDIVANSLPKMGINIKVQIFEDEENAIKWIENPIFE